MLHPEPIIKLLDDLKLDQTILNQGCLQANVGLELIDPKLFLSALSSLVNKSSAVLKYVMQQQDITVAFIHTNDCGLSKDVLSVPYLTTGRNVVFKADAFDGNVKQFLDMLATHSDSMLMVRDALRDANIVFSEYISNPKNLARLDTKRVPQLEKVNNLPNEFKDFFMGADGVDRATFDELYKSYSDYNDTTEMTAQITKQFSEISTNEIKRNIADLYETIGIILNELNTSGDSVSKPVAKSIGALLYNLADWAAMYSLYISKLIAVTTAHRDTAKLLNSMK